MGKATSLSVSPVSHYVPRGKSFLSKSKTMLKDWKSRSRIICSVAAPGKKQRDKFVLLEYNQKLPMRRLIQWTVLPSGL